MSRLYRALLAVAVVSTAGSLSGCTINLPLVSASPSPTAASLEPLNTKKDQGACNLFRSEDWKGFSEATQSSSTRADWVDTFKKLADAAYSRAFTAEAGGEVQAAIRSLSFAAADAADAFQANGRLSTREWLTLKTAANVVSGACKYSAFIFKD